jgi:membrane protein
MVLNMWLKMFFQVAESYLASDAMGILVLIANSVLSFAITLALVLLIFKYLPDAQITWRHVLLGALLTTVMLTVGRWGVGTYLGAKNFASLYGAAGSLVLVLAWVYYSTLLLLLGGEFTFLWAHRLGEQVPPEPGAIKTEASQIRD